MMMMIKVHRNITQLRSVSRLAAIDAEVVAQ